MLGKLRFCVEIVIKVNLKFGKIRKGKNIGNGQKLPIKMSTFPQENSSILPKNEGFPKPMTLISKKFLATRVARFFFCAHYLLMHGVGDLFFILVFFLSFQRESTCCGTISSMKSHNEIDHSDFCTRCARAKIIDDQFH